MSPHRSLERFVRPSKPDRLSEEQHDRIDAKRIARFSGPLKSHAHDPVTSEQLKARDHARLRALDKRHGSG